MSSDRRPLRLLAVLPAILVAGWTATAAAQIVEEGPEVWPEGDGRDTTFYACVACHSSKLVSRQGMSRERWSETLKWMYERHGMPELDDEDTKTVLDYLSRHFGEGVAETRPSPFFSRPTRPNPFLKP